MDGLDNIGDLKTGGFDGFFVITTEVHIVNPITHMFWNPLFQFLKGSM